MENIDFGILFQGDVYKRQMLNCTEQEAYFAASEAAHAIEPTAETAVGCGYMYYKKGDIDVYKRQV